LVKPGGRHFAVLLVGLAFNRAAAAEGDVFRASRLSAGNHLFPTQVLITPTSVVQHTPR
jgi:hypothetical protein